jgi:DNA-binding transcriptional LysR family regulator
VFEDIEATRSAIVDSRQTLAGTIRLVGGMTVCLYVLPPLLKEFRKHHPNVEVKVTPASATRLIRQLRTGAADLGLVTLPIEDPALLIEPVLQEELLLVMSPQHPLARKKHVLPRDLAKQPFVLFEAGSNSRRTIEEFFSRQQIAPKVVTETENVEIIKALVRVRVGISIIPYQAMAREVSAGQLACSRIAGQSLLRETGWAHLKSGRLPRAVVEMKRMLDLVAPRLRLLPENGG